MCVPNCKYFGERWPSILPKSDCRLASELKTETNPVTKSVISGILRDRLEDGRMIACPQKGY